MSLSPHFPSQSAVAKLLGISDKTLDAAIKRKYGISFSEFVDRSRVLETIALKRAALQKAMNGDTQLSIRFLEIYDRDWRNDRRERRRGVKKQSPAVSEQQATIVYYTPDTDSQRAKAT